MEGIMFKGGYTGRILRINLTDGSIKTEPLAEDLARAYIGGAGFGIKLLYDEVKKGVDPLSPENKLIFASGPLSGTSVPCASRMAITSKSPLTGAVGMSLTGGYFPVELKFAGYDIMIIEGKSERPVYISIKDDTIKIKSAEKVWGMKTTDTQQIIKNELNDQNTRVACIGPAGENLSRLACIINELRAAGRKGLGAVMGSKNLKAIAVRGTGTVDIASKEKLKTARDFMAKEMKDSPVLYPQFSKLGTPMVVDALSELGIFPGKNYGETGVFVPVEEIGVKTQVTRNMGKEHCYGCPVGCSQLKLAKTGEYSGIMAEGPEFETMYSFGGTTGVDNIDAIIAADRISDELGIDTISAGATIAFAMELYEKGIIDKKDTGGIELKFGNHKAMVDMLRLMAYREGFGDIISDGSKKAAERIGKGSEKYAMHVKGLELPGYDVRGAKAHGLNYATAYTGADHNRGYAFQEIFGIPVPEAVDRFSIKRKGALTKWNQDVRSATCDAPTMCAFLLDMAVPGVATQNTANLLKAVTGLNFTPDEIEKVGERMNNLARLFNAREGFNRKDDNLPDRILTEPIKNGNSKGNYISREELDMMLDEYYAARGWDIKTGAPTKAKLEELGLESAGE
jgi:aldehyde:ferredoxin oxidoreductase